MELEKTQMKFAVSQQTGKIIGFVSRQSKTSKLLGVREDSRFGKRICLLAKELKDKIQVNKLYDVELKPMHNSVGYVVVSARLALFKAHVDTFIISNGIYQVTVSFGNKIVYFDPKDGRNVSTRTLAGITKFLRDTGEIEDVEQVIEDLSQKARQVVQRMRRDGYHVPDYVLQCADPFTE